MKKLIILFAAICMSASAYCNNEKDVKDIISYVIKTVENSPSNTTWGITSVTKEAYTVNTPLGEFKITRENGGVRVFGVFAKLISKKGNVYTVESSIGKYIIDLNKCIVTKL